MSMNTIILENIGLTNGEVRVYIALLELGETTTGSIIKKSGITGSKVYEILEKLIEKGLVSYIIRGKIKYFKSSQPRRILDYINKKENQINLQKSEVENMIPSLEAIQNSSEQTQSSQIFEGYEGIKTVFEIILTSLNRGDEYFAFSLGDELNKENFRLFLFNYHIKRIKQGIKVKIIANPQEKQMFGELSKLKGLEIKYHDNPFPLGVFIFKDYVATFTFSEKPTCFLIKSKQASDSYKNFFISLWKQSKK